MKEKELDVQEVCPGTENTNVKATVTKGPVAPKAGEAAEWIAVWDTNAQIYYWWNTVTNETTWQYPEGYDECNSAMRAFPQPEHSLYAVLDTIDTRVKNELNSNSGSMSNIATGDTPVPYMNHFQDTPSYSSWTRFHSRTGRFTTQEDAMRLNPENYTIKYRGKSQMTYYFDVDSYIEEYNRHYPKESQTRKTLTREEINYFKRIKKEKRAR